MPCLKVVPVKGSGLQKSYSERYRGVERSMKLKTRIMLFCIVSDDNLEKCIDIILDNASDKSVGNGKIFIYHIDEVIRIRTKTGGGEAIK